jgi:hypothetical protein
MDEIKPGYTRVSDILKPWTNFDNIPPEILERKRKIGEEVHEAIHMFNCCIPVTYEGEGISYFESALNWMQKFKVMIDVDHSETRLYDDELMITGKIDALVKFPHEDEMVMVDWKTSASANKKTKLLWQLQGTLYHYLLMKNDYPNLSDRFLFIQLDSDSGLPKIHEFTYSSDVMNVAASLIAAHRYFNP